MRPELLDRLRATCHVVPKPEISRLSHARAWVHILSTLLAESPMFSATSGTESPEVATLDGLPENEPDPVVEREQRVRKIDLGDEAYAVYAHLQPGSPMVKNGDRVRRGQKLALVGNTGNSSEPHLHFHVADRPRAIDAEGVPYAFAFFGLEAGPEVSTPALRAIGGSLEIDSSGLPRWKAAPPSVERKRFLYSSVTPRLHTRNAWRRGP